MPLNSAGTFPLLLVSSICLLLSFASGVWVWVFGSVCRIVLCTSSAFAFTGRMLFVLCVAQARTSARIYLPHVECRALFWPIWCNGDASAESFTLTHTLTLFKSIIRQYSNVIDARKWTRMLLITMQLSSHSSLKTSSVQIASIIFTTEWNMLQIRSNYSIPLDRCVRESNGVSSRRPLSQQ